MKRFQGKTVMVTGAGRNMGKSMALDFAKEGANIVLCDYNGENAAQVATEVSACGAQAFVAVCDVRDRAEVFSCVEAANAQFGGIDILVNNAGGSAALLNKLTRFVDAEAETLDFVIDVNLKGSMNCAQAVLPGMIRRKYGKIINIASIAGICGIVDRVDYSAAKGGIISMAKALALEVGQYNICVNCVSPGAIERDGHYMPHMTFMGEDGRSGKPEEVTELVLFLAAQDFITGQN